MPRLDDDIAALQSRQSRRTVGVNPVDNHHPRLARLHVLGDQSVVCVVDLLDTHQPGDRLAGFVDGDGETDLLGLGADGDVDADHFAHQVDQGTAAVAGIDRGVGLDQVAVGLGVVRIDVAPQRADVSDGDRALVSEGVADGDDFLTQHQV